MKKIILALVLLLVVAPSAQAESTFGIAWNPGIPTGDTADFAGGFSFRGATAEWRNFTRSDFTLGASVGWNVFNDSFSGTATEGNITATGNQWTTVNAVPIMVNAYKYLSTDRRSTRFYFGLGAGVDWIELTKEFGYYQFKDSNWHLALAPEIGVQLPWDSFVGYVGVRYQYAFEAGDSPAQSWFDFKIGFGLN